MALNSQTRPSFWACYSKLPIKVRAASDKQFALWLNDPNHPSVQFKPVKPNFWSARVTDNYRALAAREDTLVVWFWIGKHSEYDALLKRL